jgi:LysM repeat protein
MTTGAIAARLSAATDDCTASAFGLILPMTFSRWARWCAAGLLLGTGLLGCVPGGGARTDEETEPHFLSGKKLAGQMDYDGAVEAYEKALEVNPRSAAAHFELAWLYEGKKNDPAAAIYHYERFLKLAPNSGKAEVAEAHINNCKLALAETASAIAPISASAQRDLERLVQENKELKSELAQWQAYYQSHPQLTPSNSPAQTATPAVNPVVSTDEGNHARNGVGSMASGNGAGAATQTSTRTHKVQPGDTLAAIARKYGVSLDALQAANPQVRPTRLQVGAVVNLPAS